LTHRLSIVAGVAEFHAGETADRNCCIGSREKVRRRQSAST
jgi:hypothetical protein